MHEGLEGSLSEFEGSMIEDSEYDFMSDKRELRSEDYDAQFREEKIGLSQRLMEMKKRRHGADENYEGDTEVEEIFCDSDHSDCMPIPEPESEPVHRRRKRLNLVKKEPIERTHFSADSSMLCALF
jgi:hypothetical protein